MTKKYFFKKIIFLFYISFFISMSIIVLILILKAYKIHATKLENTNSALVKEEKFSWNIKDVSNIFLKNEILNFISKDNLSRSINYEKQNFYINKTAFKNIFIKEMLKFNKKYNCFNDNFEKLNFTFYSQNNSKAIYEQVKCEILVFNKQFKFDLNFEWKLNLL